MTADAEAILAVRIPQREVADRMVWANSNNGMYTAKGAYHFWYETNFGATNLPLSMGWKKIWHLSLPHKMKVFIWRLCRNAIPVRRRLSSKGLHIPITCPMCMQDIEHMLHLFYDCKFAQECWNHVGLVYDWSQVEVAQEWLLQKLSTANMDELLKICVVLWGIWYWRNKKVWDGKLVTSKFAMDSSFRLHAEWVQARKKADAASVDGREEMRIADKPCTRWIPPATGTLKLNVDASVFPGANQFNIGMVLRNHAGEFITAKNQNFAGEVSVFEAEAVGVREALSWLKDMQRQEDEVIIESDSQLTVRAIHTNNLNYLEIGEVIESCKQLLRSFCRVSLVFIRKNANKVAHELARIPCLVNSHNIFTSPPTCLLEALSFDCLNI